MKLYKLLFLSFVLAASANIYAQDCNNVIPANVSWEGKTTKGAMGVTGEMSRAQITTVENGHHKVADISAGFFKKVGVDYTLEVILVIDCDGNVSGQQLASDFGDFSIISGTWNSEDKALIIEWEILSNNIRESSLFQVQ